MRDQLHPHPVVFGVFAHDLRSDAVGIECEPVVHIELGDDDLGDGGRYDGLVVVDAHRGEIGVLGYPTSRHRGHQHPALQGHLVGVLRGRQTTQEPLDGVNDE